VKHRLHESTEATTTLTRTVREGLISDMVITKVPVLLGSGRPLFGSLQQDIDLKLLSNRSFPSGLVQSHYQVLPQ